jgi:acetyl esterase/lipase
MSLRSLAIGCALLFLSSTSGLVADQGLRPERALSWQPIDYPEATLHARIPFLEPEREWERMDIWVPKKSVDEKLPCVVLLYGGGYGDKQGGFIQDARPLLGRGFVLAAPDYALQTDAAVPLCAWDAANAIRYLRAHAESYRIDPERIGVWGWSAGGWIAQDLCYAGPRRIVHSPTKTGNEKVSRWFPMLEPHPQFPDHSVRVQAVVSDWGAGKLWDRRTTLPRPWLSPDDPPLFTCFNGDYASGRLHPVMLLRKLGIDSEAVYGIQGNTHVPSMKTEAVREDGRQTTWGESIYDFFDRRLKSPGVATAPEILPHGGPISCPAEVRLLTVHPAAAIHYTLDGGAPDPTSPRYTKPLTVSPGQTLRSVVICQHLRPSRIATATFVPGPGEPAITTTGRTLEAELGKPFRVGFAAAHAAGASWFVGGRTGEHYREYGGRRFNPPRHIPWMRMDAKTGILSGTPRTVGRFPVIVSCMAKPMGNDEHPQAGDAILVVIHVKRRENAAP